MLRDFSDKSKHNFIALVSEVENEKINFFTDWVGDGWYAFQSWIGRLNIKCYLDNVNEYHKKVIDKNDTTKGAINRIFNDVDILDNSYRKKLIAVNTVLKQWDSYIVELTSIVNPCNGKFNSVGLELFSAHVIPKLAEIKIIREEKISFSFTKIELPPLCLKLGSGISSIVAKLSKKDEELSGSLGMAASTFSLITDIYEFCTKKHAGAGELTCDILELGKNVASGTTGIFSAYEKIISTEKAAKIFGPAQTGLGYISLVGNSLGFIGNMEKTYITIFDEDAESIDRVIQFLKTTKSGLSVVKSAGQIQLGKKVLTSAVSLKTHTSVLRWKPTPANAKALKKLNTAISLLTVGVDTFIGGAERYKEVTTDGSFDMGDIGAVGISAGVHGLTSIVSVATFGLSDVVGLSDKADEITDSMMEFADTTGTAFVESHKFSSSYKQGAKSMINYANDESHNVFARVGVSAVAGAGMITAVAIDGVADTVSIVGGWISDGWHMLTHK